MTWFFCHNILFPCPPHHQMFETDIIPLLSWCYSSITTPGFRKFNTRSPSLDLSTFMGAWWETSDLNSWISWSFGFQNPFSHMTLNPRSHCFLCAHLCHHLLLLYFPETWRAQVSLFPQHSSSLPLSQHSYGSSLSANQQASLFCFFISMVFPVMTVHLGCRVFGHGHIKDQPPFPQTSISWFQTWGWELALLCRCEMSSTKDC